MEPQNEDQLFKDIKAGKYHDYYLVYIRKSTDEPENQKNSIVYQKAEGIKFAHREKLPIAPITLTGLCVDGVISEKHSGFKENNDLTFTKDGLVQYHIDRPKFQKLVQFLSLGLFKGIVCLCWDRMSRNKGDDTIIRKLMRKGIDVRFVYPTNLIARLLYGCGLRVAEPLNLRIKDVNMEQFSFCIRGAKGGKDRMVSLPRSLIPELTRQIEFARAVWQRDKQNNIPLMLPHQLARKYPDYQFVWPWAWLFPSRKTCFHPRTRLEVRYRMHEANVQRAIKQARCKLGISVLPHELRHGYATHSMENGVSPRAIQLAMGHASLETTMGYLHAESLSVRSPLETILGGNLTLPAPT